jgi:plastocyanin
MKRFLWSGGVLAALLAGCNPPSTKAPVAENAGSAGQGAVIKSPAREQAKPPSTPTTKLEFISQPAKLEAGKAANWKLQILDEKTDKPVAAFDTVHDKLLHLIVVSKDLSWFSHLHPAYKGNGVFEIKTAIPRAGEFKLFADYTPTGRGQEVSQHAFSVGGANPLPSQPKLVPDVMKGAWMTTTARSHDEGAAPAANATQYQVALMPMPAPLEAGREVMLHFQVRDASGKPVENLQPYLGAQGHLVILSSDASTFLHAHPMDGDHKMEGMDGGMDGGAAMPDHPPHPGHEAHAPDASAASTPASDVMFHTTFPTDGIYKAWGQFKHNNKIITAPFVLKVGSGVAPSSASASVIPPNAQKVTVQLPEGYKSGVTTVKAGTPIALTFALKSEAGCGDDIVVPTANWHKKLKVGESATVVVTPQKSGELKFACSMDMLKGSIKVQ